MTASERLRELDEASRKDWRFKTMPVPNRNQASVTAWLRGLVAHDINDEDAELITVLRNALPLIADVVEAAEGLPSDMGEFDFRLQDTRDALTALRDALDQTREVAFTDGEHVSVYVERDGVMKRISGPPIDLPQKEKQAWLERNALEEK